MGVGLQASVGFVFPGHLNLHLRQLLLTNNHLLFFRSQKAGACLLPNTCLGIAAKLFAQFETQRVGISWKDVSGFPSPDENFNLAWVFYMLLAQSAIYATVTWWVL